MLTEFSQECPLTLESVGKTPMIQFVSLDSLSQHHFVHSFRDYGSRRCRRNCSRLNSLDKPRAFLGKQWGVHDMVANDVGVNETRGAIRYIAEHTITLRGRCNQRFQ